MSAPDERRQLTLRTSVLLARSREARARALCALEKAHGLRDRSRDLHEDVSYLRARSNGLLHPPARANASEE